MESRASGVCLFLGLFLAIFSVAYYFIDGVATKEPPVAGKKAPTHKLGPTDPSGGPLLAVDNSLTEAQYLSMRVPPSHFPWGAVQYSQAVDSLSPVCKADPRLLPRFRSKNSGALFARFVAAENLNSLTNKSVPPYARARLGLDTTQSVLRLLVLYEAGSKPESSFDAEVLELGLHLIRLMRVGVGLCDELAASVPVNDNNAVALAHAWDQLRTLIRRACHGILKIFTERNRYRLETLTRFARELKGVLPSLIAYLLPDDRKELLLCLQDLIDNEKDAELKAALIELRKAVEQVPAKQ